MPRYVSRWYSLLAALLSEFCGGTIYCWGVYRSQCERVFNLHYIYIIIL